MGYGFMWVIECSDGMGHSDITGYAKTKKTATRLKEDAENDIPWAWKCWIKRRRLPI